MSEIFCPIGIAAGDRKVRETKEIPEDKPYVVSGDITLLLQRWADAKGLALPSPGFFSEFRGEFNAYMQGIFPSYVFVPEDEIKTGMARLVNKKAMPTITMDNIYFRPEYVATLDITRYVDENLETRGLGRRPDSPALLAQFRKLKRPKVIEATLVDDVVFEGAQTARIINDLKEFCNVQVTSVCAGIAIGEGIDRLSKMGVDVVAVRTFDDVVDEVCERDFYPGVPSSGRTQDFALNLGVPYILPFGKPEWASIPKERQQDFSQFCMGQTKKLFEAIEASSGGYIQMKEIDRKFGRVRRQSLVPFTGALRQMIENGSDQFYSRP